MDSRKLARGRLLYYDVLAADQDISLPSVGTLRGSSSAADSHLAFTDFDSRRYRARAHSVFVRNAILSRGNFHPVVGIAAKGFENGRFTLLCIGRNIEFVGEACFRNGRIDFIALGIAIPSPTSLFGLFRVCGSFGDSFPFGSQWTLWRPDL
jgi:hypothetical protein